MQRLAILFSLCLITIGGALQATENILVCIAGASGSGKTTIASRISDHFSEEDVLVISQDSYYRDLSHLPHGERAASNFDHPDSIDFGLFEEHLRTLHAGGTIEKPIYDFVKHNRRRETETTVARRIILVEGILLLAVPEVRDLFDVKLYVDTDHDICLLRRLMRDIKERGRTLEGVAAQYQKTVRPMFLQFVEPSKRYADVIIPWGRENTAAVDVVVCKLRHHLAD